MWKIFKPLKMFFSPKKKKRKENQTGVPNKYNYGLSVSPLARVKVQEDQTNWTQPSCLKSGGMLQLTCKEIPLPGSKLKKSFIWNSRAKRSTGYAVLTSILLLYISDPTLHSLLTYFQRFEEQIWTICALKNGISLVTIPTHFKVFQGEGEKQLHLSISGVALNWG